MKNWKNEKTDKLCEAILSLKTKEECYAFLEDLCTINEVIDMSNRLSVAVLVDNKMNYNDIIKETGVSSATISRISKCYEYGNGGYKLVISRCEKKNKKKEEKK